MKRKTLNGYMESLRNYMKRTSKNKLYAAALIVLGLLSVGVVGDGTFLLFTAMVGLTLFFTKENIFE